MPNYRLQFFHRSLPRVGEVDFVMEAGGGEVVYVVVGFEKIVHKGYCGGFVVVGADVHYLDTFAFGDFEEFGAGTVDFLFARSLCYCPIKVLLGYKVGQTDCRNPIID